MRRQIKAVIFDLGGVVFGSPIFALNEFEEERGLPKHWLSRYLSASPSFARLEKGELSLEEFYGVFEREISPHLQALALPQTVSSKEAQKEKLSNPAPITQFDSRELFSHMSSSLGAQPRPAFVTAIRTLKAHGYVTVALTNNWKTNRNQSRGDSMQRLEDEGLFHHIIESCVLGVKKPSPQIYQQALRIMGRDLDFASVVFLDDIGSNVKTARSLGVAHTIKVGINYHTALEELSTIVGINLLKPYPSSHISPGARSKL